MARSTLVNEFIRRLESAERTGDPGRLVELFSEAAEVRTLTRHNTPSGTDLNTGARRFWNQYLAAFDEIQSRITQIHDHGDVAILEWHAMGALASGHPVDYRGVSILEYSGEKIHTFRTYYDSAALLPNEQRTFKTLSESVGQPEVTNLITS